MDLPRGLAEMIDEYVADALDSTGTRKARPRPPRAVTPPPIARADARDDDTLIPIEIELDPATEPELVRFFWDDKPGADADLFAQLSQQLAASESALEALPRERAPRGSVAPLPAVVMDDDEPTNVVGKPKG